MMSDKNAVTEKETMERLSRGNPYIPNFSNLLQSISVPSLLVDPKILKE
jgi:hypothetical protein